MLLNDWQTGSAVKKGSKRSYSESKRKNSSMVMPEDGFRYGIENRPSTPMKLVMGNCYGLAAEARQEATYQAISDSKTGPAFSPKRTRAQELRSQKAR
jgi:hypothetical protein